MEFPKGMYRVGEQYKLAEGSFDYMTVESREEQDAADGWFETTGEALAAESSRTELMASPPVDGFHEAPPTRAELETKARELGIAFDGRTTDAGLLKKITAKLG